VESIQCPKCGSPLEVISSTRQAVCEYCGSTLTITKGASGHSMAVLDEIKVDTGLIARETARRRLEEKLQDLRLRRNKLHGEYLGQLEQRQVRGGGCSLSAGLFMTALLIGLLLVASGEAYLGVILVLGGAVVLYWSHWKRRKSQREHKKDLASKYEPRLRQLSEDISHTKQRIETIKVEMDRLSEEL